MDNLHILMKAATSNDYRIRRIYYGIMLQSENINNETFINIVGKEKIPSLRLSIINTITPRLSQVECMDFLPVLLKDAYPAIRDKAMLLYHEIDKGKAVPILKRLIFDANSWVRSDIMRDFY